ncbi:hypothetical protein M6C27_002365, partial [Staphylococcus pseudintermedius]|nr:hypothetical protein [Staphylococcus pseudintermedius]
KYPESQMYIFDNHEYTKVNLRKKIEEENLFLQSEMHHSNIVIFFLWDLDKLNFVTHPHYFKEILFISGFLGQLASIISINHDVKGTPFAGIIHDEWKLLSIDFPNYLPLFAYALTK